MQEFEIIRVTKLSSCAS